MNRFALAAGAALLASSLACSAFGGGRPVVVTGLDYTVGVDALARVSADPIQIAPGQTTVTWTGSAEVKTLLIAFKGAISSRLNDPVCAGATCTFAAAESVGKSGDFGYLVVVKLRDGKWRYRDPRLIIQP